MSPLARSAESKTKIFESDKKMYSERESGPCDGFAVTAPSRFTDLWHSVKYVQGHIGCCQSLPFFFFKAVLAETV